MTKWQKALTKKQRAHCLAWGATSLAKVKSTRDFQEKLRAEGRGLTCSECFGIFRRLRDKGFL